MLETLLLAVVSFAAARMANWFLIRPEGMAPFWFVNGVVLAVLLRRPTACWPWLLGASFAGFAVDSTALGFAPYPNLVYGLANVVEPLLAALLIRSQAPRFAFTTLRDLRLLLLAAVVSCTLAATMAWLVGPIRWQLWLLDDLLGMLLVAPVILVFWPASRRRSAAPVASARELTEAAAIGVALAAVTTAVFTTVHGPIGHHYFYATLPALLWATLRFHARGAALAHLLLATLTIGFTVAGLGPFALGPLPLADRSLSIQAVLALLLLTHLALGLALAERRRLAALLAMRLETLDLIAAGRPLALVLERIVRLVEAQDQAMICSILLYDGRRLRHGAAPNLPAEFNRAIDGAEAGPCAGSCGAAAALGERVLIADIRTHPNWTEWHHLAVPHGLIACWSSPIFSPDRQVLGTFAIYYREARLPDPLEMRWVDAATGLASVAILRDRSELALRDRESRLRQLIETTHEGVWLLDTRGVTTYANPRLAEILGRPAAELVGIDALQLIHPDDRAEARERLARRLSGVSEQHELRLLHRDGTPRHVVIAASPIIGEGGAITGALGMITDLTERKALEAQVAATQRMESLGTLAGGIAHDFNNILTAIIGNVELARRRLPAKDPARERMDVVLEASTRAADLVRQILTFSRRREARRAVIALGPVVDEAVELLRTTAPAMLEIRGAYPAFESRVLADASQIHQIVMNLGTNAVHAMRRHAGVVEVRVERVELERTPPGATAPLPPGRYLLLTVADQGTGMDEATLGRIFDPFFTTKPPGEGTGLGLPVVLGIVASHGGAIAVASRPGEGTTFSVYLPEAADGAAVVAGAEPGEARGRGERILYVDDEQAIVAIVVSALESLGWRVVGCGDPREAVGLLGAEPDGFAALVTDHAMPGLSGLEVARAARRLAPRVPIILVSGYLAPEDRAEAVHLGVREIVMKPDLLSQLPAALSRVVRA